MYDSSPQGLKLIAACMRYGTRGQLLDSISVSRNAPKWAEKAFRVVNRSEGASLSLLLGTVQVLKAYKQLLHPCDVVHAVNHSTSPVGFLKQRL